MFETIEKGYFPADLKLRLKEIVEGRFAMFNESF